MNFELTRRHWLHGLLGIAGSGAVSHTGLAKALEVQDYTAKTLFPSLSSTYLDCASHHPMSVGAAKAIANYVADKQTGGGTVNSSAVRSKFAALIGADACEIVNVPSTSMGENLVTMALDLPARGGRIVTDALHFIGSFYLYEQLGKQGMDVVIIPMRRDGTVHFDDYAAAVNHNTRLIAVSHVSFVNGFQHDLRALADLAHAHGAYLYADLIQSAGTMPVNVGECGVDFAACGTYKWLMGDFGLAFLYVREELKDRLRRPWYGYLQTRKFASPLTHMYPLDPPGKPEFVSDQRTDIGGIFGGSFAARLVEVAADFSLGWLNQTGVKTIQKHRQPLINAIQETLTARGFELMSPAVNTSAITSFVYRDASKLEERLDAANVTITLSGNRFRISPSFFNDINDIDRLIEALGRP